MAELTPAKRAWLKAEREALEDELLRQIAGADLPAPLRQYRFAAHLGRQFRFDFAWCAQRLAVEVDGGLFTRQPSHSSVEGIKRGMEKANLAVECGWRLLRFHTDDVGDGTAAATIARVLGEDKRP